MAQQHVENKAGISLRTKEIELLCPAGDFERLQMAVLYGADAVYLGGKSLGMRASAPNFTNEQLEQAVQYCHPRNVKVYLTCNTLPTNDDVDELEQMISHAASAGVDALIVGDIGILMLAKRIAPSLDIHISTQAGVVNYLTATELYNLGATRVVLARELSLEDIMVIRQKTPTKLELEVFVHGAMCMSFSGRCLLSQYMVGRDANRGQCAQPCRWKYSLVEEKRPGQYFPLQEDDEGSYILNAKDLSMIQHLDKLAEVGVTSFKIEGRAKSAYYVAIITNAYRCALDLYLANPANYNAPRWLIEETQKVSHRQYSTGFFLPESPPEQYYQSGGYVREWDIVAIVEEYQDGMLHCTQRNRFFAGDLLEVVQPKCQPQSFIAHQIFDTDGGVVESACHSMMKLQIPSDVEYTQGSILRKQH